MPEGVGYGKELKKMIDIAVKDGTITKKQATNLHPNLVVAIIKKKRGHGSVDGKKGGKKSKMKGTHTMPDGTIMTGSTHTSKSKPVKKKGKKSKK